MQLIVLSDTHGVSKNFIRIVETYKDTAKAFLFTGDGICDAIAAQEAFPEVTIYTVKGNNDFSEDAPLQRRVLFSVEDDDGQIHTITVFMEHGDALPYFHQADGMLTLTHRQKAQIGLFGHTHVPYASMENGILILNPGSTSYPRGGSETSYAVIEIANDGSITWEHRPMAALFTEEEKTEKKSWWKK